MRPVVRRPVVRRPVVWRLERQFSQTHVIIRKLEVKFDCCLPTYNGLHVSSSEQARGLSRTAPPPGQGELYRWWARRGGMGGMEGWAGGFQMSIGRGVRNTEQRRMSYGERITIFASVLHGQIILSSQVSPGSGHTQVQEVSQMLDISKYFWKFLEMDIDSKEIGMIRIKQD